MRILERNLDDVLVQVTSPAGSPPPEAGSVVIQAHFDDDATEVVSAPVGPNGIARLPIRRARGEAVLRYSGSSGYPPSLATEVRLPGGPR